MSKLVFNISREDAEKRIKQADFLCTDLDECLFPFFTQVLVVGEIIFESLFKKNRLKYVPRLFCGASFVAFLVAVTFGKVKFFGNEFLMNCFSWTMKGIPISLIRKHSVYLHNFFYSDSLNFLEKLNDNGVKILLLSLSIQPILDELKSHIGFLSYAVGNPVVCDENGLFAGYGKGVRTSSQGKLSLFKSMIDKSRFELPIVIGHSDDEFGMVEVARAMGGLSIGINPKKYARGKFDMILEGASWKPLLNFAKDAIDG